MNEQSPNALAIKAHLEKVLAYAGELKIEILKDTDILHVHIYSEKPGRVVGTGGENINSIKFNLKNDFGYTKVFCDVTNLDGISNPKKRKNNSKPQEKEEISHTPSHLEKLQKISRNPADFTDFSKNAKHINIYIDESWPGENNRDKSEQEGVIAGIVWLGETVNYDVLPKADYHTKGDPRILTALLKSNNAMPFIMPIKALRQNAQNSYFELIEASIKILLGWLLPQSGEKCNVNIYPEHFPEFNDLTERTEYFSGVFKQMKEQNRYRYKRFNINLVQWQEKDFEYIPYADILAYLPIEHLPRNRASGRAANYKSFHGYLPLSLDLFTLLTRLDNIENSNNTEDLFLFIDELYGTKLYGHIKNDLLKRLEKNSELQLKILHAVEDRYYQKVRDLSKLRLYFQELLPFFNGLEEKGTIPTKLLSTLLTLQKSNHDGNPDEFSKMYEKYNDLRKRAIINKEFDLVVECDLNLAVHFNDRFMFAEAKEIIKRNISDAFDYLKPPLQAKLYSSLGQSFSLLKEPAAAEDMFNRALNIFSNPNFEINGRAAEIEQTTIYKLFNVLGGDEDRATHLFTSFFKDIEQVAVQYSSHKKVEDQYKHFLLLRFLYESQQHEKTISHYIKNIGEGQFENFHPWELILMYQGLFLFEHDVNKAYSLFLHAVEICKISEHGGILNLIGATIATVGNILFEDKDVLRKEGLEFIKNTKIVKADDVKKTLKDSLADSGKYDVWDILSRLPLYYH